MPKEGKSKSERFAPTSRFVSVFLPACRDTPFDTNLSFSRFASNRRHYVSRSNALNSISFDDDKIS